MGVNDWPSYGRQGKGIQPNLSYLHGSGTAVLHVWRGYVDTEVGNTPVGGKYRVH